MTTRVRTAVVFGATGYVGGHVVRRLLADGVRVVAPARGADRLAALVAYCGASAERLEGIVADVSTAAGAEAVGRRLEALGGIDLGVAAIGGWWEGPPLTALPYATWSALLQSHLTAHFLGAQTTRPYLRAGGAYVALNGIASLQPEPGSGPVSVTGAAQSMLLDVFRAEESEPDRRWHEVCVVNPVVDTGAAAAATEAVVEVDVVVDAVLRLARDPTADVRRLVLGTA